MITSRAMALALVAAVFPLGAAAQTDADAPRIFVNVNGLYQSTTQRLEQRVTFTRDLEQGHYDIARRVTSGGVIDIGGAYRVYRRLGVGVAFTTVSTHGTDSVAGSAPHPLFFDRPRAFALDVEGLRHRQRAVHLHGVWFVPLRRDAGVRVFAGPSVLSVSHAHVTGIAIQEIGPGFGAVHVSPVGVATASRTAAGFNVGADATYMVLRRAAFLRGVGAGLTVRYAGGSVRVPAAEGQRHRIGVGGFQVGAGLRVQY